MKDKLCIIALAAVFVLTGCARFYTITTTGGREIATKGKPHYDKANSVFIYTDPRGQQRTIPAGSVAQIAPASDSSRPTTFNAKPAR
ncbi:MAG: hypothetical protein RLY20_2067 [Verrucomicrobiota bacterium]